MPYIGSQQGTAAPVLLDAISVVNGQAAYTLQKGGLNYQPASTLVMQVSLNGIIQQPGGGSYTVEGSTITFASALVTGDVIDYILVREPTTGTIAPVDGSVTDSKIVSMASSKLTGALPAIDGSALTGIALTASSTIPTEGGGATTNIVQGLAKAWVNFNGTSTVTINGSFSTTSLTDNGTGDYQINFSSATSDAFYSAVSSSQETSSEVAYITWSCRTSGLTTARCKVSGVRENSSAGGAVDVFQVRTTVNGDLA